MICGDCLVVCGMAGRGPEQGARGPSEGQSNHYHALSLSKGLGLRVEGGQRQGDLPGLSSILFSHEATTWEQGTEGEGRGNCGNVSSIVEAQLSEESQGRNASALPERAAVCRSTQK